MVAPLTMVIRDLNKLKGLGKLIIKTINEILTVCIKNSTGIKCFTRLVAGYLKDSHCIFVFLL